MIPAELPITTCMEGKTGEGRMGREGRRIVEPSLHESLKCATAYVRCGFDFFSVVGSVLC